MSKAKTTHSHKKHSPKRTNTNTKNKKDLKVEIEAINIGPPSSNKIQDILKSKKNINIINKLQSGTLQLSPKRRQKKFKPNKDFKLIEQEIGGTSQPYIEDGSLSDYKNSNIAISNILLNQKQDENISEKTLSNVSDVLDFEDNQPMTKVINKQLVQISPKNLEKKVISPKNNSQNLPSIKTYDLLQSLATPSKRNISKRQKINSNTEVILTTKSILVGPTSPLNYIPDERKINGKYSFRIKSNIKEEKRFLTDINEYLMRSYNTGRRIRYDSSSSRTMIGSLTKEERFNTNYFNE